MTQHWMTGQDLQTAYNDLYRQLAKYVWPVETVKLLADLEVAVFQVFPDVSSVRALFTKLRNATYYIDVADSDEYHAQFDTFSDKLSTLCNIYLSLNSVSEVKS